MYTVLLVIHILACLFLILVVLLQAGRGAGLSVFGGGGESILSAPTTSSFMKKLTATCAVTFAFTSLLLTLISSKRGLSSVTQRVSLPPPPQTAPVSPQK